MLNFIKLLCAALTLAFCSLQAVEADPVVVWGVKVSPYVRKVLVVLNEKKVTHKLKEIFPASILTQLGQTIPDDFLEVSLLGKIPAIREGTFSVADSSVISAYLEKKYSTTRLYPEDPQLYAKALWLEKYADTAMTDIVYTKIFVEKVVKPLLGQSSDEGKIKKAIYEELPSVLDYLEQTLDENKSTFLVGNSLTIADIAIVNQLISLDIAKVTIDECKWPLVTNYMRTLKARPSFQMSLP